LAKVGLPASRSSFLGQLGAYPSESSSVPQGTSRINSKKPTQVKYFLAGTLRFRRRAFLLIYIDVFSRVLVPFVRYWPTILYLIRDLGA
jgi:hypothetical protein